MLCCLTNQATLPIDGTSNQLGLGQLDYLSDAN
jgi:hypothetical protein